MGKRLWLNILLLGIAALLVFLLAYEPKIDVSEQPQRLFKVTGYDARLILIERQNQPDIMLKKTLDDWELVKPGIAPVNNQRIRHLLTLLGEPVISQLDAEGADLKLFKLDPGKIKLTINDETLTFGKTNPITKNRYVLKNKSIYTIAEIVYGTLGSSVTHLLQHRLLPVNQKALDIEAPSHFLSTTSALENWNMLEAENIADYRGNETILALISLSLESGNKLEFEVLAIKPQLVLGRADLKVKYTLGKRATYQLLTTE